MKKITDRNIIDSIIKKAKLCRLGFCDEGQPYVLPMSFGYDGNCLYFHGAPAGRKIETLKKNNRVCVEFDVDVEIVKGETACDWDMKSQSVVVFGSASFIEDIESKKKALNAIKSQYAASEYEIKEEVVKKLSVFKVDIEELSGRESK